MADYNVPLDAAIYMKADSVIASSTYRIADFSDEARIRISQEFVEWSGQNLFAQDSIMTAINVSVDFGGVLFDADNFGSFFKLTAASGITKDAAATAATVYTLTYDDLGSAPSYYEFLVDYERSSDAETQQLWIAKGRIDGEFPITVAKGQYMVQDITIKCYPDAAGDILSIITSK